MTAAGGDRAPAVPLLLGVVALAGAGTMVVELAAVRLLAPWFGASSGVWTNVIGVILLALAVGYLIGARLSRGSAPARALGLALVFAAAATVWLPFGARPVAEAFLPPGLTLDEAASLLVWGSLAASLTLFLPAALALGCVGPLAVEVLAASRGGHAGDAGGRVLAASTAGSIAGTFGTTHLFLPTLGIERTFLTAAIVLGTCAAWVLVRGRHRGLGIGTGTGAAAGAVLLACGLVLSRYRGPAVGESWRLLAERQSPYQTLRVVEAGEGAERLRWLQVNESFDSFQSVWQPEPGLLPSGYYYSYFAPPAWWDGAEQSWRVLVLGLGAGTAVRVLEGALPAGVALSTVGVEIDPAAVALGERYFDLDRSPAREVHAGLDARAAVRAAGTGFDQVVLDCYANNMEIPAHLSTVEFFGELRGVLRDGGWLSVNAAGFGLDDPVIAAVARTLAAAFGERVLAVRVPFSRNCLLFARRGAEPPEPGAPGWPAGEALAGLLSPLEVPGAWRWVEPGDPRELLTDDENPIDRLQLASILAGRARWVE